MEKFLAEFPIQSIELENPKYPASLKQILDPPKVLYFRGNFLTGNEKCFAIVGTRLASDYGKEIAFSIAKDLAKAVLTIVSGMARGIDSFSHQGALEAGKGSPSPIGEGLPFSIPTIAVLGTGLDEASIYPQENLKLAKKILESGGALISEYPPGTKGAKFTFPQRNRIIAGISLGVLVVEAKIKSGALITAHFGRQQKKKIFAVPGPIHSRNSQGCHLLIKQGAKLVENANDILKELGLTQLVSQRPTAASQEEQLIFNALRQGAMSIDKIIEITKLSAQTTSVNLSMMEIENKVKNLGGNVYALTR